MSIFAFFFLRKLKYFDMLLLIIVNFLLSYLLVILLHAKMVLLHFKGSLIKFVQGILIE